MNFPKASRLTLKSRWPPMSYKECSSTLIPDKLESLTLESSVWLMELPVCKRTPKSSRLYMLRRLKPPPSQKISETLNRRVKSSAGTPLPPCHAFSTTNHWIKIWSISPRQRPLPRNICKNFKTSWGAGRKWSPWKIVEPSTKQTHWF